MAKNILTGLVIAASIAAPGCAQSGSEDGGPAVQRSYQVGAFERIELAGPYNVQVRTGSAPSVSATGSEKALERMVVEVRGDRLLIHTRKRGGLFGFRSHGGGDVQVTVTVPSLRAAGIAGSGDIRIDRVSGDRFAGEIAGSGNLDVGNVEVRDFKLAIAGSGAAQAGAGRAQSAEYEIAGSGDIDAEGIASETASVSIAGSGSVTAQATRTAEVNIAGSGDVSMKGGAKCNVSKHGSGEVRCS